MITMEWNTYKKITGHGNDMVPILLMCFSTCWDYGNGRMDCFYSPRVRCEPYEQVCKDSSVVRCVPVVRPLGDDANTPLKVKLNEEH